MRRGGLPELLLVFFAIFAIFQNTRAQENNEDPAKQIQEGMTKFLK